MLLLYIGAFALNFTFFAFISCMTKHNLMMHALHLSSHYIWCLSVQVLGALWKVKFIIWSLLITLFHMLLVILLGFMTGCFEHRIGMYQKYFYFLNALVCFLYEQFSHVFVLSNNLAEMIVVNNEINIIHAVYNFEQSH